MTARGNGHGPRRPNVLSILVSGCLVFSFQASAGAQEEAQDSRAVAQEGSKVKLQRAFVSARSAPISEVPISGELPKQVSVTNLPIAPDRKATDPRSVFYSIDASASGAQLTLLASSDRSAFTVSVYAQAGIPLVSTYAPAPDQRLIIPPLGGSGIVEVTLENPQDDTPSGFQLSISATDRDRAGGIAYRLAVPEQTYQDLIAFGGCDSADSVAECGKVCDEKCEARVYESVYAAIGSSPAGAREPVVTFFGIAGVNRMALVSKRGQRAVPRHYRSLGLAKTFWAVYFEDALSPFDTSIDVEFKVRATVGDFEEFDALGVVGITKPRSEEPGFRILRVGAKRFRVRPPPVVIEVAFSRQGPGYGLRQWQRAYKVYGSTPVVLSGGVFVPGTEINVERFEVTPRAPGGSDAIPFDSVVTSRRGRRQLFAVASIMIPKRREEADNAVSGPHRVWRLVPEFVGGIGLPTTGNMPLAWYSGGSWPIAWDRLSATAGFVFVRQTKLLPQYHVGDRVPLDTDVEDLIHRSWVAVFTFGLSVDLVRSR